MNKKLQTMLKKCKSVFDKFANMERYICCFLLIILVAITFLQVLMRFLFKSPFSWSEEATLMFLVWFGYLCMAVDIYDDSHAALYFLYNKMPPVLRKGADLIRHGLLTWLFVLMIKYGVIITKLNIPKQQPATHMSQAWLFAPLIVGGVLMCAYAVFNLIGTLLKPLSEYEKESNRKKTIDEINVERGGTV